MKLKLRVGNKVFSKDLSETKENMGMRLKYAWHLVPKVSLETSDFPKVRKKPEQSGYFKFRAKQLEEKGNVYERA